MTDTVIVVNTCDAYEDVWELFFCAFREYWPDCKYKIILNTEFKQKNLGEINAVVHNFNSPNGGDVWGMRLKQTLNAYDSKYVIMLYDDFILENYVNQQEIASCKNWLDENPNVAVFYFNNISVNTNIQDERFDGFELMPRRGDYKLNSAPAIWRRKKLLQFIEDNDNPWAWEFFGSYRTYKSTDLFYCAKKECENIYPYSYAMGGAIYRGKWVGKVVLPLIEKYNLKIDVNERGLSDDILRNNKRSLLWVAIFFLRGFSMIRFGVFLFIYRIIRKKFVV